MNRKRPILRCIIIKLSKAKDKEKILKATKWKLLVMYKEATTRLSADFSVETFHTRKEWDDIFTVLEKNTFQPKHYYLVKLTLKMKGGFPGGAVVESLPANAGDTGSSPGLGRSHMPRSS